MIVLVSVPVSEKMLVISLFSLCLMTMAEPSRRWQSKAQQLVVQMNGYSPDQNDDYVAVTIPAQPGYIVRFEPVADAERVHHMLLYGCTTPAGEVFWKGAATCASGNKILYAWARNAPDLLLPSNVAFSIGHTDDTVQHLVLQVHYSRPFIGRVRDFSGVRLHLSQERPGRLAAVYLFASGTPIPPGLQAVYTNMTCGYSGQSDLFPFAFRTHTHGMGRVVSAFYNRGGQWTMIGKRNPQWPQLFQPIKESLMIKSGDILSATCRFDSSNQTSFTYMGSMGKDEMCNFYMMFAWNSSVSDPFPGGAGCFGGDGDNSGYPESGHTLLPSNPDLEHHAHQSSQPFGVVERVSKRRFGDVQLGQVAGLAVDVSGNLVVFHRASRVWDGRSFDPVSNRLNDESAIPEETILVVQSDTFQLLRKYGAHKFYMPHGVFVDTDNSFYTTDVGSHQVCKWRIRNDQLENLLTLGEKFIPGSDQKHFCKPAAVTVAGDGSIFVADGYCNNRVMKFDKRGSFMAAFGSASSGAEASLGTFSLPHDIVIDSAGNRFFVADRSNGRVQSFHMDGTPIAQISYKSARNVYSVDVSGDTVYFIPGERSSSEAISAYAASSNTNLIAFSWQPNGSDFVRPHIIRVHRNGKWIFVGEIAADGGLLRRFDIEKEQMKDSGGKTSLLPMPQTQMGTEQIHSRMGVGSFLLLAATLSAAMMLIFVWRWRRAELDSPQLLLDRTGFKRLRTDDVPSDSSDDEIFVPPSKKNNILP